MSTRRLVKLGLLLVLLALVACTRTVSPPAAELSPQGILVVTNTNDSGPGSLRQAILGASPGDTITFDPSLYGTTITLTSGELVLDKSLTIAGPENGTITISGNNASRVFYVTGAPVMLRNLTITGGNGVGAPSCPYSNSGGGIFNSPSGALTIQNSIITGNSAGYDGGGIYNCYGVLTIQNSTVSGNIASSMGSGIFSYTATYPPYEYSSTTILNSTISSNTASNGGSVGNGNGLTRILYSTITGNAAGSSVYGGGVVSWNDSYTYTEVKGSIIAGNDYADVAGNDNIQRYTSLGYNLIGKAGWFVDFAQEFNQPTDLTNVAVADLRLGPLADNGGSTLTYALLEGSLAVDQIPTADCTDHNSIAVTTDQRGVTRPQGSACDIGAFEVQETQPSDTTPPVIIPTVSGTMGNDGWYISDVDVFWQVSDPESAITSQDSCEPTTIDTDTPGLTLTCTATSAGGTNTVSITIKRDATPPTITITTPADGATYLQNQLVYADYSCADEGSGLAILCYAPVGNGGPVDTSEVGSHDFIVSATDNANNVNFVKHTYFVEPLPPVEYTLTVETSGSGSVTIEPSHVFYAEGTPVTLTAIPDTGWVFSSWSGDLSGSSNPTTLIMNSNKTVTATFAPQPAAGPVLSVTVIGQGRVTSSPAGIDCTADTCMASFKKNTSVTLTATPNPNWVFGSWSGDASGSQSTVTIRMDASKNVTATFTEVLAPLLSVNPSGTYNRQTGSATISGSLTCPTSLGSLTVTVNLTQPQKKTTVTGTGSTPQPVTCNGTVQTWSATITPASGKFAGGAATAEASANGVSKTQTIQLR